MKYYVLIICIVASDQMTKWMVHSRMDLNESIPLIQNFLHLTYVRNTGAAFSIMSAYGALIATIAAFILAFGLVFIFIKRDSPQVLMITSVSMIIGGGAGNLVDRVVRGYVIDFIDFRIFPVFNVSDIFVTVGCIMLCVFFIATWGESDV